MIVVLELNDGRRAVLESGLNWTSRDVGLALILNTAFSPLKSRGGVSPADGAVGALQAAAAARSLRGRLVWSRTAPAPADAVY